MWSFISILPFMWLCVAAAACLGNVKITRKRKIDSQGQVDLSENTTEEAFLPALFRGKLGSKKPNHEEDVATSAGEEKTKEQVQVSSTNDTQV